MAASGTQPAVAACCCVCDIALGDEDGHQVVRRIRRIEAERGVPLDRRVPAIALTGGAQPGDRVRALMAGFQVHLAKPVDASELVSALFTLAGGVERSTRGAPRAPALSPQSTAPSRTNRPVPAARAAGFPMHQAPVIDAAAKREHPPTRSRGQTVIITGGSRGLGAAIAQVLGEAGMRIVIADIALERAQDRAALLGERGIEAIALPLDVGDEAQVQRAIAHGARALRPPRRRRQQRRHRHHGADRRADGGRLGARGAHQPHRAVPDGQARGRGDGRRRPRAAAATSSTSRRPRRSARGRTPPPTTPPSGACSACRMRCTPSCARRASRCRPSSPAACARRSCSTASPTSTPACCRTRSNVAKAVRFVLTQPDETVIPELMVLPMRETSWP